MAAPHGDQRGELVVPAAEGGSARVGARGSADHVHRDPDAADVLAVRQAVQQLAPRRRACVVLHHLSGLDTDEVAAVLGITPATVRSHLRHAHVDLRELLGDAEVASPATRERPHPPMRREDAR